MRDQTLNKIPAQRIRVNIQVVISMEKSDRVNVNTQDLDS